MRYILLFVLISFFFMPFSATAEEENVYFNFMAGYYASINGDLNKAIVFYKEALKENPQSKFLKIILADTYLKID
ncbi:tetratricopeptide repeat protein, partial [Candidatus Aerophobetes bacterium]|nr:tetratricopeptide repeat protein [Candidatus Aerophobetes bacterium]